MFSSKWIRGGTLAISLASIIATLAAAVTARAAADGPLSPQQALDSFKLEPGLRIELVAAEPDVIDPVAIAFDIRGRIFVAEMRDYPTGPPEGRPHTSRIVLLDDPDGDGRFTRRSDFADELPFVNSVMIWQRGIIVTAAPDVIYLEDLDGDGRADTRRVLFTGFSLGGSTQLRVNHPTFAIDNWIYLASGLSGGAIISPDYPSHEPVNLEHNDFRFRPGTADFETAGGFGQFGLTFDDYGRRFVCSNRNHIQHVVFHPSELRRNPHLAFTETMHDIPDHGAACKLYPISANTTTAISHSGTFTAACGIMIYRDTALPASFRGSALVCDPTGNLIHRDVLVPSGVTFIAKRAQERAEFLVSADNWFRPVNLANGPDGALYVCDMYRKSIEHPVYLPDAIRKITDFDSGKQHGRIYRIVAADAPASQPARVGSSSTRSSPFETSNLPKLLTSEDSWWRDTAQRLLIERKDKTTFDALRELATNGPTPQSRVHALHTLDGLGLLGGPVSMLSCAFAPGAPAGEKLLLAALKDADAPVREHACRLAAPRLAGSPALVTAVMALADDPDARVRFCAALALGDVGHERVIAPLVKIVGQDAADRWTRTAVLSSIGRWPGQFWTAVLDTPPKDSEATASLLGELGRIIGAGQPRDTLLLSLAMILDSHDAAHLPRQISGVRGLMDGLRQAGKMPADRSVMMQLSAGESPEFARFRAGVSYLLDKAKAVAGDDDAPLKRRADAIALLGYADYAETGEYLQKLMTPQYPPQIQTAAVKALGMMPEPKVPDILLARDQWHGYTPAVRDAVLSVVLSNRKYLPRVLTAVETGDMQPSAIDPARRKQLMDHTDEAIRKRAVAAFKDLQPGSREKVFEEYRPVLTLKGIAPKGLEIFKANCAQCHQLKGQGAAVGPDLSGIRNQSPETLLLHILVPNHEISPGFTNYVVETGDGRTLTGLIASETATSITIRRAQGEQDTVLRGNVTSMYSTNLSLMPEEIEKNITRQDLADLIAYLKEE